MEILRPRRRSELLALQFAGWFLVPQFRNALLWLPLPALVGLNAARFGGVFFLLLYANGRPHRPQVWETWPPARWQFRCAFVQGRYA